MCRIGTYMQHGLLRASYLEHVVPTELITRTFSLIQGQHIHSLTRHANPRIEEETCWWRVIGQSSNLPGHQGNPGHWPFGSYTNIHAKTAANWIEHAQLLWYFSIHSQVRKSTVEPLSTISQDASRCSGFLRASYLEHVVRTELINITFPLIQGSAHTTSPVWAHAFPPLLGTPVARTK